jgi:lysine 2,3-aminomutase
MFAISERTRAFMQRAFPDVADAQWNDWKWQLRMRVRDAATLSRVLNLSEDERHTVNELGGQLPVGITPYYASLLDPDNPLQGLRKTLVPTSKEFNHTPAEAEDPRVRSRRAAGVGGLGLPLPHPHVRQRRSVSGAGGRQRL